jgi:hypothetical protein
VRRCAIEGSRVVVVAVGTEAAEEGLPLRHRQLEIDVDASRAVVIGGRRLALCSKTDGFHML